MKNQEKRWQSFVDCQRFFYDCTNPQGYTRRDFNNLYISIDTNNFSK